MSDSSMGVPAVTPDPATIPTPTPTHYQQLAQQFLDGLEELTKLIPFRDNVHPANSKFV